MSCADIFLCALPIAAPTARDPCIPSADGSCCDRRFRLALEGRLRCERSRPSKSRNGIISIGKQFSLGAVDALCMAALSKNTALAMALVMMSEKCDDAMVEGILIVSMYHLISVLVCWAWALFLRSVRTQVFVIYCGGRNNAEKKLMSEFKELLATESSGTEGGRWAPAFITRVTDWLDDPLNCCVLAVSPWCSRGGGEGGERQVVGGMICRNHMIKDTFVASELLAILVDKHARSSGTGSLLWGRYMDVLREYDVLLGCVAHATASQPNLEIAGRVIDRQRADRFYFKHGWEKMSETVGQAVAEAIKHSQTALVSTGDVRQRCCGASSWVGTNGIKEAQHLSLKEVEERCSTIDLEESDECELLVYECAKHPIW